MMTTPLIHPSTQATLTQLMNDLPQSLLLTGPVGVGLGTIATYIGSQVGSQTLTVLPEKDEKVDIDKGVISVDSIRKLHQQTRSIHTGNLIIIIDYAERMGTQAQNAFLKLLEEPGRGVHFILATHSPSKLLSTITSRAQSIAIRPIMHDQTLSFIDTFGDVPATKRTQLVFMADGRPAEIARLMADDDYFSARSSVVRDARDLLQGTTYVKLRIANTYKDNRESALLLLTDASSILRRSISAKPQPELIAQIESMLFAQQQIAANGNIRLCLARLVV
jgi:DNA polymerase III, delta subunit